jgi:hypothetical protein
MYKSSFLHFSCMFPNKWFCCGNSILFMVSCLSLHTMIYSYRHVYFSMLLSIQQVCRSQCNNQSLIIFSVCKFIWLNSSIALQADTLKQKWRSVVQFSYAGLDVPEEPSLFKRSGNQKVSKNSVAVEQACLVMCNAVIWGLIVCWSKLLFFLDESTVQEKI